MAAPHLARRRPARHRPPPVDRPAPECLVEVDPVALHWVELTRRQARAYARWQLRIELAIVAAAVVLVLVPAAVTALTRWWPV